MVHPGWSTYIPVNYRDRSMCCSPTLASFAVAAVTPAFQPVVPEFRNALHQVPEVLFGRLHAGVADERTGRNVYVRPQLAARCANGPRSLLVNQPHTMLLPSVQHWRRMSFRAAHAPAAAAPQVLARSRHACLRLGRAWSVHLVPFERNDKGHISLAVLPPVRSASYRAAISFCTASLSTLASRSSKYASGMRLTACGSPLRS